MEWRDVVGYEGIYEVSDTGEVRTKAGKTTFSKLHGVRHWKQRTLKQKVTKDGTHRVILYKNGVPRTFLVHRLVAYAFIPLDPDRNCINHIDGDRTNNHVSNLEWCTYSENTNHAFDNGLMTTNTETVLRNIETGQEKRFRSMAKASEFLGRNKGYVSAQLKKGITEIDGYEVVTGD